MNYIKLTFSFFIALMLAASFFVFVVPFVKSEIADYERRQEREEAHEVFMKESRAGNIQSILQMRKHRETLDRKLKNLNEECFSLRMEYRFKRTKTNKTNRNLTCKLADNYYFEQYHHDDSSFSIFSRCVINSIREDRDLDLCGYGS